MTISKKTSAAPDMNAVAPESVSLGPTRELIDVLGGLLREMRAESFQAERGESND